MAAKKKTAKKKTTTKKIEDNSENTVVETFADKLKKLSEKYNK